MFSWELKIFADVPTFYRKTRTKVVHKNLSQGWHKIRKSNIQENLRSYFINKWKNCIIIMLELITSFDTNRFQTKICRRKRGSLNIIKVILNDLWGHTSMKNFGLQNVSIDRIFYSYRYINKCARKKKAKIPDKSQSFTV